MKRKLLYGLLAVVALALAPGAAALAQPAPAPARPTEYTLYFDFGSTALGRSAKRIIETATATAKQRRAEGSLSHVKVIGYADSAGSAASAQRLSEERARAVRGELLRLGLPADAVTVEGRGKTELAVPTGEEVREPRNRRARIVLFRPGE